MSDISPIRPSGCSLASCACVSTGCIGVLMTPGAIAFTLMPTFAYSIASDLVAALNPPLVSEASTDGTLEFACSIRLVVICTTWHVAAMPLLHLCDGELRNVKEAREVDAHQGRIIGLGILRERF